MDLTDILEDRSDESRDEIIGKAKDWTMLHGLSMRTKDGSADRLEFMSFALLPSIFPRVEYDEIHSLQYVVNELYHRIAHDEQFLLNNLREVVRKDEFTRRLVDIYLRADSTQTISLGLLRSDYMFDRREQVCKQVEVNTIAAGHGWIGTLCARFHRYVLDELEVDYSHDNLPVNTPIDGLCRAFADAWNIYDEPRSVVLFIVEDYERNIADQRYHEYRLREINPQIRVIRRTLKHIFLYGKLIGEDRRLIINNEFEVAVVYYRSGYAPCQYPSEDQWNARLMIERSRAIKCPSMGYTLAGMKKIQQVLTEPGCLERFVDTDDDCRRLRRVFANFYTLESSKTRDMAIANPSRFVLKPQREGGSNNLFGDEIKRKLNEMRDDEDQRNCWTLMDKIDAKVQRNYLVIPSNNNNVNYRARDVTSEIGIFGAIIGDRQGIRMNNVVGHMLRTKLAEADEGGVSSGSGACDSPFLV